MTSTTTTAGSDADRQAVLDVLAASARCSTERKNLTCPRYAHSRRRRASVLAIVTRWQEVRPMNAVSALGAPPQSTIARLS